MSESQRFDPMATVMSAVANASRVPATQLSLLEIIRTGGGEPSHVRAIFGDVALSVLMRVAIATELPEIGCKGAFQIRGTLKLEDRSVVSVIRA
jgi:hypothetical protein